MFLVYFFICSCRQRALPGVELTYFAPGSVLYERVDNFVVLKMIL